MKAKTFERKFDEGKNITDALDLTKARRPLQGKRSNDDVIAKESAVKYGQPIAG